MRKLFSILALIAAILIVGLVIFILLGFIGGSGCNPRAEPDFYMNKVTGECKLEEMTCESYKWQYTNGCNSSRETMEEIVNKSRDKRLFIQMCQDACARSNKWKTLVERYCVNKCYYWVECADITCS